MLKMFRPILLTLAVLSVATVATASERLKADDFDKERYRGKVLYVDFWASWCGPCRESFPWMNQLREDYSEDELAIVAINVDADRNEAEQFLKQWPARFDVVFDPSGQWPARFEVMGMPSAYLYSAEGELLASHIGFRQSDANEWRHTVDAALAGGQQ